MKKFGVLGTLTLFLLLMGSAFSFAQEEKPKDNDKPKAEESRPQEAKPGKEDRQAQKDQERAQKDQDKAQKEQEKNARRDEKKSAEMNARQNNNNRPMDEQQKHQHPADNRHDNDKMARNDNNRGPHGGKHIPDDKFRQHFGRQHTFHVQRTQIVNVSQPVVVYGGYNFQLVDAWPVGWGYDDDCYIDYVDDGYYLFDVMHPGVRIAVFVAE